MRAKLLAASVVTSVLGASLWPPPRASAGGFTLPIRGVRSLERAGAYVAGAEDADALWQNPAGLGHLAKADTRALLFDVAAVDQTVDYTHADASGMSRPPSVTNQSGASPIPTVAGALALDDRFVIAGGITAPYIAQHRYDPAGAQRYAQISSVDSTYVVVTIGAAWAITPSLRIGATLQDVVSSLHRELAISACPGTTACAADDVSFDSVVQLHQNDYVSPSGSIGIQYDASDAVTLGAVIQAPAKISSSGELKLQLPSNTAFTGATVRGDRASLTLSLPPSIRAGVEWHTPSLRVEAALDVELWSFADDEAIVPDGITLDRPGMPALTLGAMTAPRSSRTSFAPSIGAEYHVAGIQIGAGYSYESSATSTGAVSVGNVDAAKHILGIGGGYDADGWQIGGAAGFAFLGDVDVSPQAAEVLQQQPLRSEPQLAPVNAGNYASRYIVAGLRFARRF